MHVGDYVARDRRTLRARETATAGIVSAKGRSLPGDGYVPFIQTDAAVTPAIPAARCSTRTQRPSVSTPRSTPIRVVTKVFSFAIPINLAMQVKDQIVKTGKVATRGWASKCRLSTSRWPTRSR